MTGLAFGLTFALWMGFGQPRPAPATLPVSTEGCSNTTLLVLENMPILSKTLANVTSALPRSDGNRYVLSS